MRNISAAKLEDFIEEHQTGGNSPPIAFTPVVDERIIFSNYSARALSGQIAKIVSISCEIEICESQAHSV